MLSHIAAAVPMLLLLSLMLLLLLESANSCDLPANFLYGKSGEYVRQNTTLNHMRNWHTEVMGQYSPQAGKLVVAFRTPPWFRSGIGRFRVKFDVCRMQGPRAPYRDIDQTTDRARVHWLDDFALVATIDYAQLPPRIAASDFGLCLELQTDSAGSPLAVRSMSPMITGCHVSMTNPARAPPPPPPPPSPTPSPADQDRNRTLFKRLADHLWRNFGLVADSASCCLVYAGNSSVNISSCFQPAPVELVAIYYIGAVCAFSVVIAGLYCMARQRGVCGLDRCRQLAQRREWAKHYLSSARAPLRYELPETCGPPYLHLLTSCRSVGAGLQIGVPPLLVVSAATTAESV